jgi:hypothetical protein
VLSSGLFVLIATSWAYWLLTLCLIYEFFRDPPEAGDVESRRSTTVGMPGTRSPSPDSSPGAVGAAFWVRSTGSLHKHSPPYVQIVTKYVPGCLQSKSPRRESKLTEIHTTFRDPAGPICVALAN